MYSRLICLLLVGLSLATAEDKLAGGPYVLNVGPKSATIAYVVQTAEVRLGASGAEMKTVPVLRSERVSMTGLKPGTRYEYNVLNREEGRGSFRTPPSGRGDFEFVVFGDTRGRHDVHQRVVNSIVEKTQPDFVIHTGDLVADGADTALWPIFFAIEKELLRKAAFFPVLGNHERNDRQYHDFFDSDLGYYSFNWGSAHFTALNSDFANSSSIASVREAYWAEQMRWLENDLTKNQTAEFRFVIAHHPPITAVGRRQGDDNNERMKALIPILEKYNVTAIFNGHDHNYQHHFKDGVHYVVTGGGGAPLYEVDKPVPGITLKVESVENFVQVKVEAGRVHVTAVTVDGRVLEAFDIAGARATR
jgi:predicted phosphodiesterase